MSLPPVLSYFQTAPLLEARKMNRSTARSSVDLGLNEVNVNLEPGWVDFPENIKIPWELIEEIQLNHKACYLYENGNLEKIQRFSSTTNRFCSLYPTESAPTLVLGGFPMHRIKGTNPYLDTLSKIHALRPMGAVLDTATGLGYTAIQASQNADSVTTIELDPAVLEVARLNPWSRDLFNNRKISLRVGDSFEVIQNLSDNDFTCILHDPPTISLAGDLFSLEFYNQLYRVLQRKGRLFHYIGDLESRSGHHLSRGIANRLSQVGFRRIQLEPRAFGILAYK